MQHNENRTRILYNGACKICNGEITTYARYAAEHDLPLWFEDLNQTDLDEWGLSRREAMRILHIRHEGESYAGLAAYLILWAQMPRYRPLARFLGAPLVRQVATVVYDKFLSRCLFNCTAKAAANTARRREQILKP